MNDVFEKQWSDSIPTDIKAALMGVVLLTGVVGVAFIDATFFSETEKKTDINPPIETNKPLVRSNELIPN